MIYKNTTQVPNYIFALIPSLSEAELKILLIVIRQTIGWHDAKTKQRKQRDRITILQFVQKTGLAKRTVTKAIQTLSSKNLIVVTNYSGARLTLGRERKGKPYLFYSIDNPQHLTAQTTALTVSEPEHQNSYNKTNFKKKSVSKLTSTAFSHITYYLPAFSRLFRK
ncbi:MAG: replication protein [Bacteroidetes bacterium]|nr:replication protein [Bacteroidota bacterium]